MGVKERIDQIGLTAGRIASEYSSDAVKAGMFVSSGIYLESGNLVYAAAYAVIGGTLTAYDHHNIKGNLKNFNALSEWHGIREHGRGVVEGRSGVLQAMGRLSEAQFHPEEPVYTPLDGSTPIKTPIELMQSLGGDVRSITTRVELVLRHAKKREGERLTTSENETLRRALSLFRLANIWEGDLNEDQTRRYYEIQSKVFRYEGETRNNTSDTRPV